MKIRAFITHKKAEHFIDCQDRFSINCDTKSVAVSDGMSQSWQQKIWAQLLVDTFCATVDWVPNLESVRELSPVWKSRVEDYIQYLRDSNAKESIIYRNERCLASGKSAGATLVGVRFDSNKWSCDVLGDSCLIAKQGDKYVFGTSQDTEKFDNHPDYFDSDSNQQGRGHYKTIPGELSSTNPFVLLVSDPFSDFLLEHNKAGDIDNLVNDLLTINTHEEFEAIVAKWRSAGMHNDDTTLIIMEYDGVDDWTILYQDDLNALIKSEETIQNNHVDSKPQEESTVSTPTVTTTVNEPIVSEISEDEFCKEFLGISEDKFTSCSMLNYLFSTKKDRKNKMQKILTEIAKLIYKQYVIRKK